MFMKTLPTNVLQIILKIIPNSKVIIENIIDPDDNSIGTLKH